MKKGLDFMAGHAHSDSGTEYQINNKKNSDCKNRQGEQYAKH